MMNDLVKSLENGVSIEKKRIGNTGLTVAKNSNEYNKL